MFFLKPAYNERTMSVIKLRPRNKPVVFFKLWQLHFPMTAIISIAHRLSGIAVFAGLPYILLLWQRSLQSAEAFTATLTQLQQGPLYAGLILWSFCLLLHSVNGIRHLCMDLGLGETYKQAWYSAWLCWPIALLLTVVLYLC
jgi:succinate dehydrogenase / fumarate reductase cytochrome b subunit